MKFYFITIFLLLITAFSGYTYSSEPYTSEPYTIELEQISIPGSPAIHSFAFAEANGKWLFIGGRTNGLHGFTPVNAFPKQFSNRKIYVVDPLTMETWSRDIFADFPFTITDQLRSTNMEYTQVGNKLFITGGYGYDSTANFLVTFPLLTVIDVQETIQAVVSNAPITNFLRQITDDRMKITGGELHKMGDYFYLVGGHTFNGTYRRTVNDQVYSNQIRKFKIIDDGVNISISDYSAVTNKYEFHRRDMNVTPGIKPDGISEYISLYGGVFKPDRELPFLNPVYIDSDSASVDYSFEQKMNQYTCAYLTAFNQTQGSMHTTFFGGMSLYFFNETNQTQEVDSLIPFIDDITTLTKYSNGSSEENISTVRMPAFLGANAKFILNNSLPHYDNEVIKLNEISGRTFAGYIYGGIRALLPNNGLSYPSEYIFKVCITPVIISPVELTSFNSSLTNRNLKLNWSTSSEINNSGFSIERLSNNRDWTSIGFVKGHGNSSLSNNYVFRDNNLSAGKFNYRLKQLDVNGNFEYYFLSNEIVIGSPTQFSLSQNYPNPFNPSTNIRYQISNAGLVSLKVFDTNGKEILTLVKEKQNADFYNVNFNSTNLPSGVYFYSLAVSPDNAESAAFLETKKMVLMK